MNTVTLTPTEARRLAVSVQCLAGPRPQAGKAGIIDLLRRINCLQIDPIRAVERTQLLVLWSRIGAFDPSWLDDLQRERVIIEGDAHQASYVLTEDYHLFRRWIGSLFKRTGDGMERARAWMEANETLRAAIVERLGQEGPLTATVFNDLEAVPWYPSRWFSGKPASMMMSLLSWQGVVLPVGRKGNQRLWQLRDAWLPEWAEQPLPQEEEVVGLACQRSLKALGVAGPRQISRHFIRGKYPNLARRLAELAAEGTVLPAQIVGEEGPWDGEWYIHRETVPLLESVRDGGWAPRTVFLSPFDNLICDRERTEQLFDFYYRIEIYVPKAKREYGYYVLPLLHGDRFIGRMDSQIERKTGIYRIHAFYEEEGARVDAPARAAAAGSLLELARFIGAKRVELGERIPAPWRDALEKEVNQGL
ncbi:MAG: winged helix DNA-binding domain-containing protein [Caldilineaceae bacterium]|nr:winged helix DNA-binding domain-containing protein [Caldilineaceae bacterium]MDE0340230.1 winged helix DNA-binding domain-containing protein [Caldilineaceae bacterium]